MKKRSKSIIKRKIFDSHTVFDENYLKTKLKPYKGTKNTKNFNCKVYKEGLECLPLIVIDSVLKLNKSYFPRTFLKERKRKIKKKKIR